MSEAIKEAEKILKQYYGYDHFREGQIPVIKAVLGGGRTHNGKAAQRPEL